MAHIFPITSYLVLSVSSVSRGRRSSAKSFSAGRVGSWTFAGPAMNDPFLILVHCKKRNEAARRDETWRLKFINQKLPSSGRSWSIIFWRSQASVFSNTQSTVPQISGGGDFPGRLFMRKKSLIESWLGQCSLDFFYGHNEALSLQVTLTNSRCIS